MKPKKELKLVIGKFVETIFLLDTYLLFAGVRRASPIIVLAIPLTVLLFSLACNTRSPENIQQTKPPAVADLPTDYKRAESHNLGDVARGKEVFRFETFGNENFWADAMRWQQGVIESKITPKQILEIGLQIDSERLAPDLLRKFEAEFKTDLSPQSAPTFNDPNATVTLLNQNAIIGVPAKDTSGDGKIDILRGDKTGVSCAICHTVTDKSLYNMPNGGTAGKRIDGLAPLTLSMGAFLAVAKNSRAYYPNMQQSFLGISIGRAPTGAHIRPDSTEEEVDAYLRNPAYYPVGTFDETHDGFGNAVKNVPLFRQDLAAPYGSAGEHALFDNISNSSYTVNLDMTTLATPEGREFLMVKAGPAGVQMHEDYKRILAETGVTNYPYIQAELVGNAGDPASAVGRRVANQKLFDMTAYAFALPAPVGAKVDEQRAVRGKEIFRANCTSCHNADQNQPVTARLVDLKTLWPGYTPVPAGVRGDPKERHGAILNSPGAFDDKMVLVDSSDRGEPRGNAVPLLLDLDRTTLFLHDASVPSLDRLLDPERGSNAPHPFYLQKPEERLDMIEFLRGLDTDPANDPPQQPSRAEHQSERARAKPVLWGFGFWLWSGFLTFAVGLIGLKIRQASKVSRK